jgi:hypothetical protein
MPQVTAREPTIATAEQRPGLSHPPRTLNNLAGLGRFVLHFAEMWIAMMLGMAILVPVKVVLVAVGYTALLDTTSGRRASVASRAAGLRRRRSSAAGVRGGGRGVRAGCNDGQPAIWSQDRASDDPCAPGHQRGQRRTLWRCSSRCGMEGAKQQRGPDCDFR